MVVKFVKMRDSQIEISVHLHTRTHSHSTQMNGWWTSIECCSFLPFPYFNTKIVQSISLPCTASSSRCVFIVNQLRRGLFSVCTHNIYVQTKLTVQCDWFEEEKQRKPKLRLTATAKHKSKHIVIEATTHRISRKIQSPYKKTDLFIYIIGWHALNILSESFFTQPNIKCIHCRENFGCSWQTHIRAYVTTTEAHALTELMIYCDYSVYTHITHR